MSVKFQTVEASIASAAQKGSLGGGGLAVLGGLTANEVAALVGVLIALVGLIVQIYYKRKDDCRREERHRLYLAGRRDAPLREDEADG